MDQPAISRGDSRASQRSIVPVTAGASTTLNESAAHGPIIQTADKQWIDLDLLHPKLIKELRRQYSTSTRDEPTGSLGKGAAKLRAFARQTKSGLDIRLRRKVNAEHDEVTDIQLVAEPESREPCTPELPAGLNEISELPDTSVTQELDSSHPTRHVSTISPLPSEEDTVDTLPRYEARTVPTYDRQQLEHPTLSEGRQAADNAHQWANMPQPRGGDQFSEGLQMLIDSMATGTVPRTTATTETVESQQDKPPRASPRRLKIARTTKYETETDVEPSTADVSRKRLAAASKRKGSNRRPLFRQSKDLDAISDSEEELQLAQEQPVRKKTISKKRARSDMAANRVNGQTKGEPGPSTVASQPVQGLPDAETVAQGSSAVAPTISLEAPPISKGAGRELPKLITDIESNKDGQSPGGFSTKESGNTDTLWQPSHRPDDDILALPKLALGAAMGAIANSMLWMQRNCGPTQLVESGKVRVRWTCSCGAPLHDDFTELRPGAARELEAYLNRPKTQAAGSRGSPTSPQSSRHGSSFPGSSPVGIGSSQISWTTYGSSSSGELGRKNSFRSPITYAGLPLHSQSDLFVEPPWLLTSTNEGRYTPKVSHIDMSPMRVRSDKDLALALRDHYFAVDKKWWRSLRVRGLTTIEFVQFEVHRNRFADIRKSPDMPMPANEEYSFEPVDLLPPVGSQYLLHLFKHPEDYDGELITYLRAPKRHGRLHVGVGWGIDLIEGFRADRVWLFVSGLFALGSLVFAAVWAHKKHNVQGASGIAAYIVSLAVLVIGWLQACLG